MGPHWGYRRFFLTASLYNHTTFVCVVGQVKAPDELGVLYLPNWMDCFYQMIPFGVVVYIQTYFIHTIPIHNQVGSDSYENNR